MDWNEEICLVDDDSADAFNNVMLFCLVIGISHKSSPEQLF